MTAPSDQDGDHREKQRPQCFLPRNPTAFLLPAGVKELDHVFFHSILPIVRVEAPGYQGRPPQHRDQEMPRSRLDGEHHKSANDFRASAPPQNRPLENVFYRRDDLRIVVGANNHVPTDIETQKFYDDPVKFVRDHARWTPRRMFEGIKDHLPPNPDELYH